MKGYFPFALLLLLPTIAFAQTPERSKLDSTGYGVVYEVPPMKDVKVTPNVAYFKDANSSFALDIYTPPNAKPGDKIPAVVFLAAAKDWEVYKTYPRLVAAHGMIGISLNSDYARTQELFEALFQFIEKDGAKYGIDASRLGVYAASANVTGGAAYLLGPKASKGIKAAVLYYGGVPNLAFRKDLPVLFFVSEGDVLKGQQYGNVWQKVMESRAPWTIVYGSRMPHAFDVFTDTDDARRIVRQTIEFWRSNLETIAQPSWKPSFAREVIASIYDYDAQKAADLLTKFIADNPRDAVAHHQYGRFLAQLQRLDDASKAYQMAIELGGTDAGIYLGLGQIRNQQKRYEDAVNYLTKAIQGGARFGGSYTQLAIAQVGLNRVDDAVKTYETARQTAVMPKGTGYYNIACAYSLAKQADKAFEWLNKAIDEGFANRRTFETDSDLDPLRSDSRYQAVLARLSGNSN